MVTSFYIRIWNDASGTETIVDPLATGQAARVRAIDITKAYFGIEDVTWHERVSKHQWVVGRRFEDGPRSGPFVVVTVHRAPIPDEGDT